MNKNPRHPEYQYLELMQEILDRGTKIVDRGTDQVLYSVFGRQCRYDLNQGFPLLTTKRVYWQGVLQELYWFLSGQTNIKYLVDNKVHIWDDYPYKIYLNKLQVTSNKKQASSSKQQITKNKQQTVNNKQQATNSKQQTIHNQLPELSKKEFIEKIASDKAFAKKWGELPRIYGEMWRAWPTRKPGKTVDQLQWVIDELTADPFAKNAIVTSWNPEYLYTMADPEDTSYFPICHNMYQLSIKDDKLYLQLYQRSADLFLGVPFNIASYALLTHILAKILGLGVGEFVHTFGDVHIYGNHLDQAREQLSRKPKAFPEVKIADSVTSLSTFSPDKVELAGYEPHATIKGELTVAGGFYDKKQEKILKKIHRENKK